MSSPPSSPFDAMMSFGRFVPGFEFLQGLVSNAEKALPSIGQWVAPTLDPGELDKRISDLKAVQFWLEQNGRMLATTIQALEVQKMTLSTLKTMNVSLSDLQTAVMATPSATARPAPVPAPAPAPTASASAKAAEPARPSRKKPAAPAPAAVATQPAVDAMEWWGALTQQFSHLANAAMTDTFKGPGGRGEPAAVPAKAVTPAAPAPKAATKAAAKPRKKS